jgi:hypothetical protein
VSSERASTQDPEATRVEHHVLRARIDRGKVGTWWALGLCALLYLYVFPYQERINNPNENVRFYMTAALVEDGTYAIDGPRARWGWVNDAGVRDGHYYSVKAPGTSLLGVPAYAAYRAYARWTDTPFERTRALYYCRLFASVLPTLIFAFFFHRFLGRHTHDAASRDGVFFSVLVGSLLYGYGLLFVSHTASAIAAGGALILIADDPRSLRRPSWAAFATGLLAALVTWFEYPGLIASASLASAALVRFGVRRAPFIAAGGLLPTLSMMHFQWKAWGSPLAIASSRMSRFVRSRSKASSARRPSAAQPPSSCCSIRALACFPSRRFCCSPFRGPTWGCGAPRSGCRRAAPSSSASGRTWPFAP